MKWEGLAASFEYEPPSLCRFGLTEGLALGIGALTGGAIEGGLATGLAGAGLGAAGGAALSGFTGGDPLKGALTGGLTGGAVAGLGPVIGSATGLGTTAGDVLAGAGAGLVGSAITGQNPLTAGLLGGATGLAAGALSGTSATPATTTAPTVTGGSPSGGTASAVSQTAGITPAGAGGAGVTPVDLTTAANPFGTIDPTAFPASVTGTTGGVGGSGSGSGNWATNLFGSSNAVTNTLGKIPPAALFGGAVLGADLLMGDKPPAALPQLQAAQAEAGSTGRALSSYMFSGTLPPGAQAAVDQAHNAATAQVKSNYAKLGLSGSTMEAQALEQVQQATAAQKFQFADQLLKEGANYAQISDNMLAEILKAQTQQQDQLTAAIGQFAAGLAGAKLGGS